MRGEQKAVLFTVGLVLFCVTILGGLVFIALWDQRGIVAWVLLGVCVLLVLVRAVGKVNEQVLRHKRYRHQEETPLDMQGNPLYLPAGAQRYTHRTREPRDEYL